MKNQFIILCCSLCLFSCWQTEEVLQNQYFDLENFSEEQFKNLNAEDSILKRVIMVHDQRIVDSSNILNNSQEMHDLFEVLKEYNLNLDNLTGSYKADSSYLNEKLTVTYTPLNEKLDIKSLEISFLNDQVNEIKGYRENMGFFSQYIDSIRYCYPNKFFVESRAKIILQNPYTIQINTN